MEYLGGGGGGGLNLDQSLYDFVPVHEITSIDIKKGKDLHHCDSK